MSNSGTIRIKKLENLDIRRPSNEDLFLLKAVSGRDVDLDDMRVLFQTGLHWDIIISELKIQFGLTNRVWTVLVIDSLEDLEKEYDLQCPRISDLKVLAQEQMDTLSL